MKYYPVGCGSEIVDAALIYPVMLEKALVGYNVYDNSPEDQALIAELMAEITARATEPAPETQP